MIVRDWPQWNAINVSTLRITKRLSTITILAEMFACTTCFVAALALTATSCAAAISRGEASAPDGTDPGPLRRFYALQRAAKTAEQSPIQSRIRVLEDAADAAALVKRHDAALAYRREALSVRLKERQISVADLVGSYAAIAQELQHEGKYKDALLVLGKAGNTSSLDATSLSILSHFTSSVHDCMAQPREALQAWMDGWRYRDSARAGGRVQGPRWWDLHASSSPEERLAFIDLLAKAARASTAVDGEGELEDAAVSPEAKQSLSRSLRMSRQGLTDEHTVQVSSLLAVGPWSREEQLPKTYIPGIHAQPWHSMDPRASNSYPHLQPVHDLLHDATSELRTEYRTLSARHLLLRETECIHASGGGWRWFATNGYWQSQDENGCATASPAACRLLERIAALNITRLRVLRAGYSAVESRAHLRPHCGTTNGQLKMHLGLIVPMPRPLTRAETPLIKARAERKTIPDADNVEVGDACARIRVGNETRAWRAGGLLFFDDSFSHEVWNDCDSTRVVFQLVFRHPDLDASEGESPGDSLSQRQGGPGPRLELISH